MVARPRTREFASWGTLDGAYVRPKQIRGEGKRYMGGKPLWLMNALVRDYSRTGDLVCDPCAGSGTTLRAALINHRRAVGAEMDADAYEHARKRLDQPVQPALFDRHLKIKSPHKGGAASSQLGLWRDG